jgi:hypothetical protein
MIGPKPFECGLHHILGIGFMAQVLQYESVEAIRAVFYANIIFLSIHCDLLNNYLNQTLAVIPFQPVCISKTDKDPNSYRRLKCFLKKKRG